MINKSGSVYLAIISFMVFAVLSFFVHFDFFRNFDYKSLLTIQGLSAGWIDYVFSILTLTGSTEFVFSVILIIFAVVFLKKKKLFTGIFLLVLLYPLELIGKLMIFHPKPPIVFSRYVFSFSMPISYMVPTNFSYPSGHMARSTFVSILLIFFISGLNHKYLKSVLLFLVLLYVISMFVSRIYLGEHWFSNVLGGFLLGTAVGLISVKLY